LAISCLAAGMTPVAAARAVLDDVADLPVEGTSANLRVIVLAADGQHAAVTNVAAGGDYVYWTPGLDTFARAPRAVHEARPGRA
jgi:hypothetical protein